MIRVLSLVFFLVLSGLPIFAQEINVEAGQAVDFSKFKSFTFGTGEIITPKDQKKVGDKVLDEWIKNAITRELEMKGLKRTDSAADLTISYVIGTMSRSDMGNLGPMGLAPGSNDRTFIHDYQQTSLIIDLHDSRSILVWRINSTTNMSSENGERIVEMVVSKGFKKFGKSPRKKK